MHQAALAEEQRTPAPMLTTLDRYLMRLVLRPTLIGLAIIMLLLTAFTMTTLLREAALDALPAGKVLTLLLVRDLIALQVVLPTAFFVGLVMALSSWHSEREAYVCYAAGISPARVARPVVLLAVLVAALVALLCLFVRPWSYAMSYQLDGELTQLASDLMQPGRFYRWNDSMVIHAQGVQDGAPRLTGVFAASRSPGQTRLIRARYAHITPPDGNNQQQLQFIDGTVYELNLTATTETTTRFQRLTYETEREGEQAVSNARRARPTQALLRSQDLKEVAEWQWRFCLPLITLLLALVGIQLSRLRPQQTPYLRFGAALLVYVGVFNVMSLVTSAVERGQLPATPGVFAVVGAMALLYGLGTRVPRFNLSRPG